MDNIDLILTLTGGLASALLLGYMTQRIGLSPIVGYLLAGIVVGPYTPGFVADRHLAEQLAEIGVILLMFGVGLQFHLDELLAVKNVAIPGAVTQSLVATLLGALVARAFGWSWSGGIVFGMALAVASTVVLVRILTDHRDLHTPTGHIAVGWLVVEDLFTVLVLVLLPALFAGNQKSAGEIGVALGLTALKVAVLAILVLVVGARFVPWLLERVVATQSRELFTLTVLVLALGIAVGSARLFDVSMALGAFVAGMAVGRSDFSLRAATDALPMRDAFAVLFFVSVGMLLDPRSLLESPALFAATLAIILVGKPLSALIIVLILRYPFRVAFAVAVALAQIGEFSFILANVAKALGILPNDAGNILVAASIVSITLNPLLYRLVDPVDAWLSRRRGLWSWLNPPSRRESPTLYAPLDPSRTRSVRHRTILVGYGPVGQTLTRILTENEIEVTVVELDIEKVRALRENATMRVVYGDAAHADTLEAAGIGTAGSLILSSAGMRNSGQVIQVAREINPGIEILARATYIREIESLRQAGATTIVSSEVEMALALTERILRDLGASPEQIDRERERVYAELVPG